MAHCRLGIEQGSVSIGAEEIYDDKGDLAARNLGRSVSAGIGHVWDEEGARDQVLAYYSGYAALLAAGYSREVALFGAEDDFEWASQLIDTWQIGSEPQLKEMAEAMMLQPENIAAVARIAEELMLERRLEYDHIEVLVDVADGQTTEEQYQFFKQQFAQRGK